MELTLKSLKSFYVEKIALVFPLLSLLGAFLLSDALTLFSPLNLGYGALFYWTVYRPDLIPLTGLFLVGVLVDGLMGRDLGISFLQILFIFTLTLSQRFSFFQASFSVMWVGFMFFMALFTVLCWALHFILEGGSAYETIMLSYFWVVVSYPFLSLFLIRLHHLLT